ncbi:MAG: OmpH family outer membrane protein [Chitinophagales bacterium]
MKTIINKIKNNSKKLILALVLISAFNINANAQRFVYVDMEYILDNLPEYKKAQEKLDDVAEAWRAEIATKMEDVETSYKRFQSEQVLMNDKMKGDKIAEIEAKEKAVKEYQRDKFGPNGELFKKRQELIKPIQDKIYKQIEILAQEKSYDFILDKSSGIQMLYANEKYDKSAFILAALKTQ